MLSGYVRLFVRWFVPSKEGIKRHCYRLCRIYILVVAVGDKRDTKGDL
jgi:hypothetical protein